MPDGSLYAPEHEMTLKVEGLEKPRRKRGRPPKPPPGTVIEEMKEEQEPEPEEEEEDADGRKRRRRKVPSRFKEAVQVQFNIYYIYSYNTRIICTFVLCTYTF